jgi:hypothetical protein
MPRADHLAKLNHEVHLAVTDKSVGPRCVVAWRFRKGGAHDGGGGHQFYTGTKGDADTLPLPQLSNGMDVSALVQVTMPHFIKGLEAFQRGEPMPELNKDEINAELARLPDKPDEDLR